MEGHDLAQYGKRPIRPRHRHSIPQRHSLTQTPETESVVAWRGEEIQREVVRMKNFKPFFDESSFARSRPTSSNPFFFSSQRKFAASASVSQDEGRVIDYSYGLNLALAGKGVTNHISSISNIFVHDGAIGSSPKCDVKVRLISDNPSAMLSLSHMLWETPTRAVSQDSCPLTVYVATSISPGIGESIGLGSKENDGFIAADIERSSLILCGKAFSDSNTTKEALAALSGPVIFARGGLPLSARLLVSGDSVVLLFAPKRTFKSCRDLLVPSDAGVILYSNGLAFLFQTGGSNLFKLPASVFLASSDSSGVIPSVSKLSPGQAAYHFLAGYQNGKFIPAYNKGTWSIDPLELAKAFMSKLKDDQISSYLFNVNGGENNVNGKDFAKVVQSTLSENIPPFQAKSGGDLEEKYKSFLLSKFPDLPEEFSF
ncbi:hypothetical protein Prudu_007922 [Prunus dulcis]|uniref:phosphoenolpyruvate carboxykinase (ATP) n=1 Tax=Prunus dulcis TaxID=3755 RepID=A0A4Y1R342_PRUDU|nr:hypothetical protein Prudu_007922 [Prunus dulcis]